MPAARVLIVDDELYVRKALKRALNKYDVVLAASGSEAIAHLQGQTFDVVLCDLMMPSVTGADVYQHVAENAPGQEQRFVFLTGGSVDKQTDDWLAQLPNPVLEKPFNVKKLRSFIDGIIEQTRVTRR